MNPQQDASPLLSVSCPRCHNVLYIPVRRLIDNPADLEFLLSGAIHTGKCQGCTGFVEAEIPIRVSLEQFGIRPLYYVPFRLLEKPATLDELAGLPREVRVCHSMDELFLQVEAELLLAHHCANTPSLYRTTP